MTKRFRTQVNDPDINPCIEEGILTQRCLDLECYQYANCSLFFDNYKKCKMFWGKVKRDRIAAGIKPYMPTKLERDKIVELRKKGTYAFTASE